MQAARRDVTAESAPASVALWQEVWAPKKSLSVDIAIRKLTREISQSCFVFNKPFLLPSDALKCALKWVVKSQTFGHLSFESLWGDRAPSPLCYCDRGTVSERLLNSEAICFYLHLLWHIFKLYCDAGGGRCLLRLNENAFLLTCSTLWLRDCKILVRYSRGVFCYVCRKSRNMLTAIDESNIQYLWLVVIPSNGFTACASTDDQNVVHNKPDEQLYWCMTHAGYWGWGQEFK